MGISPLTVIENRGKGDTHPLAQRHPLPSLHTLCLPTSSLLYPLVLRVTTTANARLPSLYTLSLWACYAVPWCLGVSVCCYLWTKPPSGGYIMPGAA